ncbi:MULTISPECIES: amino-acid N-acetyltransferase [Auritidibacter]|uniref:amino-acid N-acetyltransferase n=1 Tax=Auritidibacter TaxID=1160973 RepID=UPI000D73B87C|nr:MULTISPECIES: amino-acid N-acetyltransferase [unclassified Auritidibacter]AXR74338.1 amino-acid N-acetyltransferase [Auritidibacter sp. NML130574]PXA79145.1 amino-acid N-acetyltransferase [Auritidibacter sp. NML120636]
MTAELRIRPARTSDVSAIRAMVTPLAHQKILLDKEAVAFYEAIQEFVVAEDASGTLLGFGALHVMWEDLAEVRTLATAPEARGRGVGSQILGQLIERATRLGVDRIFCLTFETTFFASHGFEVMADQSTLDPEIFAELLRSTDEGVAEFLDLARVKPNTLGNTRMILHLDRTNDHAQG